MATRILGPTGSKKRRRFLLVPILLVALAGLYFAAGAMAVHDTGAFELDGNATTATSLDWDQVCYQATADSRCGTTTSAGAEAASWTADTSGLDPFVNNPNATIFTGGGSKDPQDVNQWAWKDGAGGLPDKDNLVHSFAARYKLAPTNAGLPVGATNCPNGTGGTGQPAFDATKKCDVLFFGSDRFDNSGDAQQGFWFFQNPIALGNTPLGGGTSFTGTHANGDLLIISDFSNGGTTSTISVYKWNSAVSGNLQLLQTSAAANCNSAGGADAFCGIVNAGTITMPWPFLDKSGTTLNRALNGEFYEGGVNLSTLGLSTECFSSVASETRSSTSTTATLKDFVLGNFGKCTSGLTTTPKQSDGTTTIPAGGLSIGTGSVVAKDSAALAITGSQNWTGNLKFFLCKEANTTDTCTTGGTQIGPVAGVTVTNATTQPFVSDAATITAAANGTTGAPGRYCWRAVFTSGTTGVPNSTDSAATECFIVNPVLPTLSTNATAAVAIGSALDDTATLGGTANEPGTPAPGINPTTAGGKAGGTITFTLYSPSVSSNCGTAIATRVVNVNNGNDDYKASAGTGSGSLTPTAAGTYYWIASYSGDNPNTLAKSGACGDTNESSRVVDAKISVSPLTATNEVNHAHTITATVNQDDGIPAGAPGDAVTGFGPAPNGTTVTFSLANNTAGAAFVSGVNTCTTTGGTCTVQINTSTAGSVDIHATSTFSVGGVSLTRATGTGGNNGADANKVYVDANITVSPLEATNVVGDSHTLVVTVQQNDGLPASAPAPADGVTGFGPPPVGTIVTVTLTNDATTHYSVISDGCAFPGGTDAFGKCSVVFTSPDPGTVTEHASVTLSVGGQSLTRATGDGLAGDSANAVKHFVKLQPTMNTAQRFVPNDSATISVASGAGNLVGHVVFKLYVNDPTCTDGSGQPAYTSGSIDITDGTPTPGTAGLTKTVASGNTTAYTQDGTTFSWVVTYLSDKAGHQNVSSLCTNETSSITIHNGSQQP
jgi:hypothetical protein